MIFSSKKFTRPYDFFRAKSSQGLMIFLERKVHKAIAYDFFRAKSLQGLVIFFRAKSSQVKGSQGYYIAL